MGSIPAILVLPTLKETTFSNNTPRKLSTPTTNPRSVRKLSSPLQLFNNSKTKNLRPKTKKTYSSLRHNYTNQQSLVSFNRSKRSETLRSYRTTRSTPRKSTLFFQFKSSPSAKNPTNSIAEYNAPRMLWLSNKPYHQVKPDLAILGLELATSNSLQNLSTVYVSSSSQTLPAFIPYSKVGCAPSRIYDRTLTYSSTQNTPSHCHSLLAHKCAKHFFARSYDYSHSSTKLLSLWTSFDRYLTWSSNRANFSALNILGKNKYKKYFSHYTYVPSTGSKYDNTTRYKIPDLSFSARGSLVRSTKQVTNLLPTDSFMNQLTDELSFSSQLILTREQAVVKTNKPGIVNRHSSVNPYRGAQTAALLSLTGRSQKGLSLIKLSGASSFYHRQKPFKSRSLGKNLRRIRFLGRKKSWRLRKKSRLVRRLRQKILKTRRLMFRHIKIRRKIWRRSRRFLRSTLTSAKRLFNSKRPRSQYAGLSIKGLTPNSLPSSEILKLFTNLSSFYQPSGRTSLTSLFTTQSSSTLLDQSKSTTTGGSLPRALNFSLTSISKSLCKPVLLRYFVATQLSSPQLSKSSSLLQNQLCSYRFGSESSTLAHSNLWSVPYTHLTLRKHLLQRIVSGVFSTDYVVWYCKALVHFLEDVTGRRVNLNFGPFVESALTFSDRSRLVIWRHRVAGFQRMLGHKIFVQEALMLIIASIRLKDPTFLANWIRGMLKRMSFWKYRLIFRYIKFVLQHLLRFSFEDFQFKGFKLRLKGKISVAGNARTRTLVYRVGNTSHSKMSNKVAYDLSFVNTFTGVMGFKLWFFY